MADEPESDTVLMMDCHGCRTTFESPEKTSRCPECGTNLVSKYREPAP